MPIRSEYKPSRNAQCLCGSGRKFKKCCAATYKAQRPIFAAFTAFNEGRYEEALSLCRADITRYVIWHKSHTEPLLGDPAAGDLAGMLLDRDMHALFDILELLLRCYEATDRLQEFPAVLGRLKRTVAHPRWEQRLVYYHALAVLGKRWNEGAGREVLRQLEPFDNVADPEILELHLDLNGEVLGFARKNQIIDRIVCLAEAPVDRLHYRCLKGVELFLVGDLEGSAAQVEHAIQEFREERKDSLTSYERYRLGHCIDFLGVVTNDPQVCSQARDLFEAALLDEDLSPSGRAHLHTCIAETWMHAEDWQKAKDSFLHSLDYEDTAAARVLAAECFVRLDDISRALDYLGSVEFECLPTATKADYAFTFAAIAISPHGADRASEASELLTAAELPVPYFRERRDRLLLALQSLQSRELTEKEIADTKGTLSDLVRLAGHYLVLKPNIAGLGLDVNKIIEHLCGARGGSDHERRT